MLDYRILTFLKLCDTMNYHVTAELMNMTQPAVTQHIKYLEREYHCRLFFYNGKKLIKTKEGKILEDYARAMRYNEQATKIKMSAPEVKPLRIGTTKTIGDYVIKDSICNLTSNQAYNLSITVDNTKKLLYLLDHNQLDFALIEGFFDKQHYGYKLYRKEPFVGICHSKHPFAGKSIPFESLFAETIIIREEGSGTRAILEQVLRGNNFSLNHFSRKICLSSFEMIKACILNNIGITFAYKAFAKSNSDMRVFTIDNTTILREFNYVFLKDAEAEMLTDVIQ